MREITFEDRLTVAGYASTMLDETLCVNAVGSALVDAVRCCGEFPECSHVLAWVEARDTTASAAGSRHGSHPETPHSSAGGKE